MEGGGEEQRRRRWTTRRLLSTVEPLQAVTSPPQVVWAAVVHGVLYVQGGGAAYDASRSLSLCAQTMLAACACWSNGTRYSNQKHNLPSL